MSLSVAQRIRSLPSPFRFLTRQIVSYISISASYAVQCAGIKDDDFLHYNKDSAFLGYPRFKKGPPSVGAGTLANRICRRGIIEDAVSRKGFE